MKPISVVLALVMTVFVFGVEADAIIVGPYNVTVNLSEYADIQSSGPDGNSETGVVKYLLYLTKGNSTMPSEDVNTSKLIIQIAKSSMPIDPANIEAWYNKVEKGLTSGGLQLTRQYGVLIDGHWAASWKHPTGRYQHIGYFLNNNVFIEIGAFDLPTEDMDVFLRTFHVQET
jgi:hypothetical protein